jgi:DNA-binding NarL/FixJ family response regulator
MPDVLIVDRPQVADDDLEQLERFSTQHPNIACVALCIDQDPQFLLQAMRAGVREVLPSRTSTALYPALERIAENSNGAARPAARCWPSSPARAAAAPPSSPPTWRTRWPPAASRRWR